ncbi:sorting and assembly machinery component 50 homolog B-like [Olea europaea subsp. europaea]|nr:sorting and assembly machinery component 50 homolog B-like [Olea europaea subsp. europaea]
MGGNSSPVCTLGGPTSLLGFKARRLGSTEPRRNAGENLIDESSVSSGIDFIGGDLAITAFADLSFDLPLKVFREAGIHAHAFACTGSLTKLTENAHREFSFPEFRDSFRSSAGFGMVELLSRTLLHLLDGRQWEVAALGHVGSQGRVKPVVSCLCVVCRHCLRRQRGRLCQGSPMRASWNRRPIADCPRGGNKLAGWRVLTLGRTRQHWRRQRGCYRRCWAVLELSSNQTLDVGVRIVEVFLEGVHQNGILNLAAYLEEVVPDFVNIQGAHLGSICSGRIGSRISSRQLILYFDQQWFVCGMVIAIIGCDPSNSQVVGMITRVNKGVLLARSFTYSAELTCGTASLALVDSSPARRCVARLHLSCCTTTSDAVKVLGGGPAGRGQVDVVQDHRTWLDAVHEPPAGHQTALRVVQVVVVVVLLVHVVMVVRMRAHVLLLVVVVQVALVVVVARGGCGFAIWLLAIRWGVAASLLPLAGPDRVWPGGVRRVLVLLRAKWLLRGLHWVAALVAEGPAGGVRRQLEGMLVVVVVVTLLLVNLCLLLMVMEVVGVVGVVVAHHGPIAALVVLLARMARRCRRVVAAHERAQPLAHRGGLAAGQVLLVLLVRRLVSIARRRRPVLGPLLLLLRRLVVALVAVDGLHHEQLVVVVGRVVEVVVVVARRVMVRTGLGFVVRTEGPRQGVRGRLELAHDHQLDWLGRGDDHVRRLVVVLVVRGHRVELLLVVVLLRLSAVAGGGQMLLVVVVVRLVLVQVQLGVRFFVFLSLVEESRRVLDDLSRGLARGLASRGSIPRGPGPRALPLAARLLAPTRALGQLFGCASRGARQLCDPPARRPGLVRWRRRRLEARLAELLVVAILVVRLLLCRQELAVQVQERKYLVADAVQVPEERVVLAGCGGGGGGVSRHFASSLMNLRVRAQAKDGQ